MTGDSIDIAGRDGGWVSLTSAQLADLQARVDGLLLRPGAAGWDDAVLVWNAMAARTPALVLQPTSARDVAAAVAFARDHALLLSIKGWRPQHRRNLDRRRGPHARHVPHA